MKLVFKLLQAQFINFLHPDRSKRWFCSGFAMFGRFLMVAILLSCHVASSTGETLDNGVSEKILAFAGETVILPCHITLVHDIPTVEWSKQGLDPDIIFLYRDGCETFEMKNQLFQYRTSLIMNQLKNGDISLIISNVTLKDAGKYQCVILRNKNPQVVKTLELDVGAVSEPKLRFVRGVDDGVTLQCEANCWFPEPKIMFLDDQGNSIRAETAKRSQDSTGCFTVTRRVTLQTATNRVICQVHQSKMNKTRETEKYIPAKCLRSCTKDIIITALVMLGLLGLGLCTLVFICKKWNCVKRKMSGQSSDQSTKCRNAKGVNLRNQADSSENVTTELLQKMKELKENLCHKDMTIHQLTEELNDLRSRQGPALQLDHPVVHNSPSRPSSEGSKPIIYPPHQLPHDNNPKPLDITSNNHPKPGNSSKNKDSNPGVLRQNPALGPTVQTSSHNHDSAAVLTNNAALPSCSFSASMSEEKHLVRSKSLSRPHSNDAKIPRRYTISAASYNRYSPLANLPEESEMLLTHEQE